MFNFVSSTLTLLDELQLNEPDQLFQTMVKLYQVCPSFSCTLSIFKRSFFFVTIFSSWAYLEYARHMRLWSWWIVMFFLYCTRSKRVTLILTALW